MDQIAEAIAVVVVDKAFGSGIIMALVVGSFVEGLDAS